MTVRYTFDPGPGRFTVQAFASGMLSFLGHNPTFVVRDYGGEVQFDPAAPQETRIHATVRAASLQLADRVTAADRRQIEEGMNRDALETAAYPEIIFESVSVEAGPPAGDEWPLHVAGRLTLHGVTRPVRFGARLTLYNDGVRLAGEFLLNQSEFQMKPVVALGGTLRLKDAVKGAFDLVAWKEGHEPHRGGGATA